MALQRDKNIVRLPSGSGIGVNPPQANILTPVVNNTLSYLEGKIDRDNTYKQDEHERQVNELAVRTQEIENQKRIDKSQQTEIQRRINADKKAELEQIKEFEKNQLKKVENFNKQGTSKNYSLAVIALNKHLLQIKDKYWNDPKNFETSMMTYFNDVYPTIENYVDQDGMLQTDYSVDFLEYFNTEFNNAHTGIKTNYYNSVAEADRNTLLDLSNSAAQNFWEGVQFIDGPTSLISHNMAWTNQMSIVQKAYDTYTKGHDKHSQMSLEQYAEEIHMPMLQNHDTAILTHALTNEKYGLYNGTLQSVENNEYILQLWSSALSNKKEDINILDKKHFNLVAQEIIPDYFPDNRKKLIMKNAGLLANNTHHNWGYKEEQKILDDVSGSLTKIRNKVEDRIKLENTVHLRNADKYLNNIDWTNPEWDPPTENQLRENSKMIDHEGNLVPDPEKFQKYKKKLLDRNALDDAANSVLMGNELDALSFIKKDNEYYSKNKTEMDVTIKEHAFRKAFGADFNTLLTFSNLAKAIRGEDALTDDMQNVMYLMDKLDYFPQDFKLTLERFASPNFVIDTDQERETLIDLATVYNYVAAQPSGVGVLNLEKNHAIGLKKTYEAYQGKFNTLDGVKAWNGKFSPNKELERTNQEVVNLFLQTNYDTQNMFNDKFSSAMSDTENVSFVKWINKLKTKMTGNEVPLSNIMKDDSTWTPKGFWKNFSIKESAYPEFKKIVNKKLFEATKDKENLNNMDLQNELTDVLLASIEDMTNTDYFISYMAFDSNNKGGFVLTENGQSPEEITGQESEDLSTNALAFMVNVLRSQDGDELANMMGLEYPSDELGTYMNNLYSLVEEGNIKLQYNPKANDKKNEEFFIWFKNSENTWTTVKQDGRPVSWIPNNRYLLNMGYTRTSLIQKKAIDNAEQNIAKLLSKKGNEHLQHLRDALLRDEIWLQKNIILPLADKWESIKDSFTWDDQIKNTLTEQLTQTLNDIDISVQEEQTKLDEDYDTKDIIYAHYSQFNEPINLQDENDRNKLKDVLKFDDDMLELLQDGRITLTREEKVKLVADRVDTNFAQVREVYADIGTVIHPVHQFVLQDIVDVGGIKLVDKNSDIYQYLQKDEFSLALKEIKLLAPYFPDQSRLNALINMWGSFD